MSKERLVFVDRRLLDCTITAVQMYPNLLTVLTMLVE